MENNLERYIRPKSIMGLQTVHVSSNLVDSEKINIFYFFLLIGIMSKIGHQTQNLNLNKTFEQKNHDDPVPKLVQLHQTSNLINSQYLMSLLCYMSLLCLMS